MSSPVANVSTGFINTVNDAAEGMPTAPTYIGGSYFAGQLGKTIEFDDSNVVWDTSIGTVYGGVFQYVKLAAAAGAIVPGQILFWDMSTAAFIANYQVTTSESLTQTDNAVQIAGICLNSTWTVGNYAFIQIAGKVPVKFRAVLTSAGADDSAVYAAAAGGADLGLADVLSSANPTLFSDVALMQRRFLGTAAGAAPVGGATSNIFLGFQRLRG